MTARAIPAALASLILVAVAALPRLAGAQSCEEHGLLRNFDPQATTAVVDGFFVGFRSPENAEPIYVWLVGDPDTQDGCVGGIAPGSSAPTGKLEVSLEGLLCVIVNVETSLPYTAELFDPQGMLVSSETGSAPSYGLALGSWAGYRLVLTPGTLPGGERVALCADNLRVLYDGLPVRARTWGTIKTIYR